MGSAHQGSAHQDSAAGAAALLLLADGRFPAGGHAHSGGVEAAVRAGRVTGPEDLSAFCLGRLHTAGLVAASLAAAACAGHDPVELDAAADARTPAPSLRAASRRLGRQLLRAARAAWPALAAQAPHHQPVILGLAARAAGLTPRDAALAAAHDSVSAPATAAVRLLGMDPYAVVAVLARLAGPLDAVAAEAHRAAEAVLVNGTDALPAASAPLLDITAEQHAAWPVRLFAS